MDDLIRRQDLNETMKEMIYESNDFTEHHLLSKVWDRLRNIESVQQTGKWIGTESDGFADGQPVYYEWTCSVCGCVFEDEEPLWNFCPNCGARMVNGD